MAVHQIDRLDAYIRYLQLTPAEVDALFRDLLIGRAERDPAVPSESIALDKSNIWGGPLHLRLPARGGLAQCCRLTVPRGIYIKVER